MAIKTYEVTFSNNKEYLVQGEFADSLKALEFMNGNSFLMEKEGRNPIAVQKGSTLMVKEFNLGQMAANLTVWRIK